MSVDENIKNTFLNSSSALFEEPENLLKQEVREPSLYNAIISAIATGASKLSEISTKVGENSSTCTAYLKNLISLGLVRRETPYGEKNSKKTIYTVEDNMFRFWYRFIHDNASLIVRVAHLIWPIRGSDLSFPIIWGKIFEDICTQYLWQLLLNGKSPVFFKELGRWWGTDPATHAQTEIDIMGEQDKNTALFCECKWTNDLVDSGVLELFVHRSQLFHYNSTHLFLFSKNGFTSGCTEMAEKTGNVTLVSYSDIYDNLSIGESPRLLIQCAFLCNRNFTEFPVTQE